MSNEKVSPSMQRIFFHHILENPAQFEKVSPYFFEHEDIKFIYQIIREDYLNTSVDRKVPSKQQILTMVRNVDLDNKVSNQLVKQVISGSNDDHNPSWIKDRFEPWKLSNKMRDNIMQSIELIRNTDDLDRNNVEEIAAKLKLLTSELNTVCDDDDDLGSEFDDIEAHIQDASIHKIKTGWKTIDDIMLGGWDYSSLNVLVGQTNAGKSMWLNNIAVNAIKEGKNVVFISLEMSVHKCMKRMGAMNYRIPIGEYDDRSKDAAYMRTKFKNAEGNSSENDMFTKKALGKMFVKKYPTGSMTITDLDLYLNKLEMTKQIKIDMVLVDYISIMGIEKGVNADMLFLKGKHLAEGLRYVADKHNVAMITATQTGKDVWDANDLGLKDIPESKAIAETADAVWGIIRNPQMKKENKYRLKPLKLRDGEFGNEILEFDFVIKYLSIENDIAIDC